MVEILGCYSTTQTVLYAGCRPPLLWVAALGRKNIFLETNGSGSFFGSFLLGVQNLALIAQVT